jgi:hypothetical protein
MKIHSKLIHRTNILKLLLLLPRIYIADTVIKETKSIFSIIGKIILPSRAFPYHLAEQSNSCKYTINGIEFEKKWKQNCWLKVSEREGKRKKLFICDHESNWRRQADTQQIKVSYSCETTKKKWGINAFRVENNWNKNTKNSMKMLRSWFTWTEREGLQLKGKKKFRHKIFIINIYINKNIEKENIEQLNSLFGLLLSS